MKNVEIRDMHFMPCTDVACGHPLFEKIDEVRPQLV